MRLVGIVIALVLALSAGYLAFKVLGGPKQQPKESVVVTATQPDVKTSDVVVASRQIQLGEVVQADMLETQPWPAHLVLDGFITSGGDGSRNVLGMVARSTFQPGEPVIKTKLSNPQDPSFLAAALPKGKKVVTIATDGIAGLAGFVFPGDRVDVVVTHEIPKEEVSDDDKEDDETVSETLLSDIRVMAVDQRSESVAANEIKPPSSVSLEVTLEDAQKLRLAQETGHLSLVLRALEDKDVIDTTGITRVRDLSQTDAYDNQVRSGSILVVRGTELTKTHVNSPKAGEEVDSKEPHEVPSTKEKVEE